MNDTSRGMDSAFVTVAPDPPREVIYTSKSWQVNWKVEKWNRSEDHEMGFSPDEVMEVQENLLVSGGINLLLNRLIGMLDVSYPAYSSGNAYLRVGDSSTAATSGDPDLQASSNKLSVAMDASYPQVIANSVIWRSTFGSSQANFVWNEVGVVNGSGAPDPATATRLLNRKVQNFGTKASGSTWTLTLTILIT